MLNWTSWECFCLGDSLGNSLRHDSDSAAPTSMSWGRITTYHDYSGKCSWLLILIIAHGWVPEKWSSQEALVLKVILFRPYCNIGNMMPFGKQTLIYLNDQNIDNRPIENGDFPCPCLEDSQRAWVFCIDSDILKHLLLVLWCDHLSAPRYGVRTGVPRTADSALSPLSCRCGCWSFVRCVAANCLL